MAIRTALGTKSRAICDRCGFEYPYLSLRPEWTGHRVCIECWESKHPQLTPHHVNDAIALRHPRVGENQREDSNPRIKIGFDTPIIVNAVSPGIILAATPSGIDSTMVLGMILMGIDSPMSLGTVTPTALVEGTGISTPMALGNETPQAIVMETGIDATMQLGTVTASVTYPAWGQSTWSSGTWGN